MSADVLSLPALTRAAVQELSNARREPDWLRSVRLRAFDAFEAMPVPDQHTEGWRRTNLRGLPLQGFRVSDAGPRAEQTPHAVDLREAVNDPRLGAVLEEHFAKVVIPESDKFTALHYAFLNAGSVIFVPRGNALESPLWLRQCLDASQAAFVHTLIVLEDGADARIVEEHAGGSLLASGVVEQVLGDNSHLRYIQLQRFASDVWSFSWQRARLAQDSSLRSLNVALGARLARNTVQVVLEGRGSQADLLGIVEGVERQHVDFETLQDHFGDATRSDLVIHDALRGRASANFTGLIRINKSAHQTESSQQQKNILLSDGAKADSDPKLEILNNDVIRCTHGASVGPLDEETVFYLQSRGLDRVTAEQLIVEGFFRAVLDKVGLPELRDAVWAAIEEKRA